MSWWYVSYAKRVDKGWLCWLTNAQSGKTFLRGSATDANFENVMWEFCDYLNKRVP